MPEYSLIGIPANLREMTMDSKGMFDILKQQVNSSISPKETKVEKCYYDCYRTDYARVCEQSKCLWRDSCLELAPAKHGKKD